MKWTLRILKEAKEEVEHRENRKPVFLSTFFRFKEKVENDIKVIGIIAIAGLILSLTVAIGVYVIFK